MREYYSRVLAYIACGASIAAGTYTQYFSYGILWMVPYALLYPHLAYHLGQRFRQHDPRKVTRALLAVDAVHCGLGMALLGFSVVPSLMFLLVLSFTALVIGGLRLLGMALLISASSALLVAVLVAPPLLGNTPVEVAAVSILFCGLQASASPPSSATSRACAWPRCARRSPASRKRPRGSRATWPSTCRRRSGK
ncbi:MASE2 domain-containing protein [Pseudomonas aeruginosa]|nr:MASE2 domain-containing protein [Pseudomonas aeruginosa]